MKRTTVNQWCLLCAATAISALALTGCVEEGEKPPPQAGQQGPTAEVPEEDAGAGGADMGAGGSDMGGSDMGGSAGMATTDAGGTAGTDMGAGGSSLDAGAAADAG